MDGLHGLVWEATDAAPQVSSQIRREIAEKKWEEARSWSEGRIRRKNRFKIRALLADERCT